MKKRADIPLDIRLSIFGHLSSHTDLFQYILTCKDWREPGQNQRYQRVNIKTEAVATLFVRTIQSSPDKLGCLIHIVDCKKLLETGLYSHIDAPTGLFMNITNFCPNIKEIKTSGGCVYHDFYDGVLREFKKNGKFKHLETIPFPVDEERIGNYVAVALTLHKNLTRLLVVDDVGEADEFYGGRKDEFNKLRYRLKHFPKVKSLEVVKHCNKGINNYSEMFDRCPSLESLDISIFSFYAEDEFDAF